MVQKLMYSREEVASALGLSLRLVDRLISDGLLAVKHIGRRVLISQASVDRLLNSTETESPHLSFKAIRRKQESEKPEAK